MTSMDLPKSRNTLRSQYRAARRRLNSRQQTVAEQHITQKIHILPAFLRAKNIALYWPDDGEISTLGIIEAAWRMRKNVFLPVIDLHSTMRFVSFAPNDTLSYGKWGIRQPKGKRKTVKPLIFDLIITPLVAFDLHGNRLGRGGGYYDRFLSQFLPLNHRQCNSLDNSLDNPLNKALDNPLKNNVESNIDTQKHNYRKPFTLGIAHACQQANLLPTQAWDVNLSAVATDKKIHLFQ